MLQFCCSLLTFNTIRTCGEREHENGVILHQHVDFVLHGDRVILASERFDEPDLALLQEWNEAIKQTSGKERRRRRLWRCCMVHIRLKPASRPATNAEVVLITKAAARKDRRTVLIALITLIMLLLLYLMMGNIGRLVENCIFLHTGWWAPLAEFNLIGWIQFYFERLAFCQKINSNKTNFIFK